MSRRAVVAGLIAVGFGAAGLAWSNRSESPLPSGTRADLVVVQKSTRQLSLYSHGLLVRSYQVALGRRPNGSKEREGDHRTPEGLYVIDRHNPTSAFHLALHISYPSATDSARALAAGYTPGGDIMIHGMRNGLGWIGRAHRLVDWTDGCVALTDAQMDQVFDAVPNGTRIDIRP